jgi:hypothetical protein
MTASADFWARKLAKEQPPVQPRVDPNQPWWRVASPVPQQPAQQVQPETVQPEGEYNPRKLMHTKSGGICPDCGGNNFFRGTSNTARRCFECGYVEGRDIADPNRPMGMTAEGPAQRARQTAAGGARINNYQGNISTASEAVSYISGV